MSSSLYQTTKRGEALTQAIETTYKNLNSSEEPDDQTLRIAIDKQVLTLACNPRLRALGEKSALELIGKLGAFLNNPVKRREKLPEVYNRRTW